MSRLSPLSEEPTTNEGYIYSSPNNINKNKLKTTSFSTKKSLANNNSWKNWFKAQCSSLHQLLVFNKKSNDIQILLSVLACPLFPVSPTHQKQPLCKVSSTAQYIVQHYAAATSCKKLEGVVKNIFATGKVTMAMGNELNGTSSGTDSRIARRGCFVIWQMVPNKWLIELAVDDHKVVAGSDGNVAWRHTPWLGTHAAKGGVRPLRRTLEGLDPLTISAIFSTAQYTGEKCISGTDCFMLKLVTNQSELIDRSDNAAEMIKHVTFGYFSQRNGLLVYLEDSYLTRIQSPGSHPTYWETTMGTMIEDYRAVEGVMIAHRGHSSAIITRFGDNLKSGLEVTRMEENWVIDDVAFNVVGLSMDCFIPPKELKNFV